MDAARDLGFGRMALGVVPGRTNAIALYRSLGFVETAPSHEYPFEMVFLARDLLTGPGRGYSQVTWRRDVRPRRGNPSSHRRNLRRAGRGRRHHGHRCRARRRVARAARRARRQGRLRVGHVVEVVEARPRRHPVSAAEGSRARLRSARRTPDPAQDRTAPRARAPVPAAGVHEGRSPPPPHRAPPRRNDVGVRPHRRSAHRQAAQACEQGRSAALHADAAGRQHRRVVHLLRRPGRRRAPHAHRRQDGGHLRRRGRQLRDARRSHEGLGGQGQRRARAGRHPGSRRE